MKSALKEIDRDRKKSTLTFPTALQASCGIPSLIRTAYSLVVLDTVVDGLANAIGIADRSGLTTCTVARRGVITAEAV